MTAFATIFGILPVALSLGASSGSRKSLGIAVIGGMVFATFLSLYVVPILYSYISREYKPETEEPDEEIYEPIFR
jgi:multidrug efflux pump